LVVVGLVIAALGSIVLPLYLNREKVGLLHHKPAEAPEIPRIGLSDPEPVYPDVRGNQSLAAAGQDQSPEAAVEPRIVFGEPSIRPTTFTVILQDHLAHVSMESLTIPVMNDPNHSHGRGHGGEGASHVDVLHPDRDGGDSR
jgi:hypothetical protein